MTAAWTPDLPDGLVESPSAAIAAGQPPFDPEALDGFETAPVCGAEVAFVIPPSTQHPDTWQKLLVRCTEDEHDDSTPHRGEVEWGGSAALPADPACGECADVGVTPNGKACHCEAGKPFRDAEQARAEGRLG